MNLSKSVVSQSIHKVVNVHEEVRKFFHLRGVCQFSCLDELLGRAFPTLYGKVGEAYGIPSDNTKEMFIEVIIGSFRACFPQRKLMFSKGKADLAAQDMRLLAEEIVEEIFSAESTGLAGVRMLYPEGVICANARNEDIFPMDDLQNSFGAATSKVIARRAEYQSYLQRSTKDCQRNCIVETVTQTMLTLFLTNNDAEAEANDALTGAIRACYPGAIQDNHKSRSNIKSQSRIPSSFIKDLVDEGLALMKSAKATVAQAVYPLPECYTGSLFKDTDHELTMEKAMDISQQVIGQGIQLVISYTPHVKEFFDTRGSCQFRCLSEVLGTALFTLYGTLGEDYGNPTERPHGTAVEVLTGSFQACFPKPDRSDVKQLAEQIAKLIEKDDLIGGVADARGDMPVGISCAHDGREDQVPLDDIKNKFSTIFGEVEGQHPEFLKFIQEETMDCQSACVEKTVSQAILTLFLTDNAETTAATDAVTGALRACYPGIGPEYLNDIVKKTVALVDDVHGLGQPQCYTGKLSQGLVMKDVMKLSKGMVGQTIKNLIDSDEAMNKFFNSRLSCQFACVDQVLDAALPALYGRLGEEYATPTDYSRGEFTDVLVGSFRACFPKPDRSDMVMLAEQIIQNIGRAQVATQVAGGVGTVDDQELARLMLNGVDCANAKKENLVPIESVKRSFGASMSLLIARREEFDRYLQQNTRDCQRNCTETTVAQAILALFLTGNTEKSERVDALTGAIYACYPGIPSTYLKDIVSEASDLSHTASKTDPSAMVLSPSLECYTGSLFAGSDHELTMQEVMALSKAEIGRSIETVTTTSPLLKEFFYSQGSCQFQCLEAVLDSTVPALYGKLGYRYGQPVEYAKEVFMEVIIASFRTCIPNMPSTGMALLAREILSSIEKVETTSQVGEPVPFPTGTPTCLNSGEEDKFPLDAFTKNFEASFETVVASTKNLNEYLQDNTQDCQKTCLQKVVPQAVFTLYLTGKSESEVSMAPVSVVSAALHACYPGIPSTYVDDVVSATLPLMWKVPIPQPECYTGNLFAGTANEKTMDQVVNVSRMVVGSSIKQTCFKRLAIKKFFSAGEACEYQCLDEVLSTTFATLYGKLGQMYDMTTLYSREVFKEVIVGSFRACFPKAARYDMEVLADQIMTDVKTTQNVDSDVMQAYSSVSVGLPNGTSCVNEGQESHFPMVDFKTSFEAAIRKTITNRPELQRYLQLNTKDCQGACAEKTITQAALTLFLRGKVEDSEAIDAVTGALHACYPGIPSAYLNDLVTETAETMKTSSPSGQLTCYDGPLFPDTGFELTMEKAVKLSKGVVAQSLETIMVNRQDINSFFNSRGWCQFDCVEKVLDTAFNTLYGKLGQQYGYANVGNAKEMFIEVLIGSFQACFPKPSRPDIKYLAETIVDNIKMAQETGKVAQFDLPQGTPCKLGGQEDKFPMDDFRMAFAGAIGNVIDRRPGFKRYLQRETKDCQETCIRKTVSRAALTLFLTGNQQHGESIDAVTGALHACYPGIKSTYLMDIVEETADAMQNAQDVASINVLNTKKTPTSGIWIVTVGVDSSSVYGLVAAACMLVIVGCVVMARRINRHSPNTAYRGYRQFALTGDHTEVIEEDTQPIPM